ncbi:hypothetical protein ABIH81_02475 [Micromonospora sp. HUAS YX12]|uniref:Uncharacterized protein n=1 Tax=Micromonospora sp. HUAS YX12 TaxID=3156396 RepID=A0AAU7R4I0_9ACTN
MPPLREDKKQIGLTKVGKEALAALTAEDRFASESDAYKFAIAYAIAKDMSPDDAPDGGYETKFNAAGGLDLDGVLRNLLLVLEVGDPAKPYTTAERLAEVGICALARRIEDHESLAEIMAELA